MIVNARKPTAFCDELGENGKFISGDVRLLQTHKLLVEEALDWTGQLDVYINNAGVSWWRSIDNIDEEFLNSMIDTNLKSVFWGCQAAAQAMKGGGSIINISSLASKRGSANNSAYCAAKFGVNGVTQSLAKELGSKDIRVNAVCPVYVKTDNLLDALKEEKSPAGGGDVKQYFSHFESQQAALKRLPLAEEIAKACYFLAESQSSAITGQCINVDCGVLPQ